jgi:hypothetical protein
MNAKQAKEFCKTATTEEIRAKYFELKRSVMHASLSKMIAMGRITDKLFLELAKRDQQK